MKTGLLNTFRPARARIRPDGRWDRRGGFAVQTFGGGKGSTSTLREAVLTYASAPPPFSKSETAGVSSGVSGWTLNTDRR
ncbi:MAG: hypothetical protein ABSE08_07270 [Syntrophobacteraceae bacterium]